MPSTTLSTLVSVTIVVWYQTSYILNVPLIVRRLLLPSGESNWREEIYVSLIKLSPDSPIHPAANYHSEYLGLDRKHSSAGVPLRCSHLPPGRPSGTAHFVLDSAVLARRPTKKKDKTRLKTSEISDVFGVTLYKMCLFIFQMHSKYIDYRLTRSK